MKNEIKFYPEINSSPVSVTDLLTLLLYYLKLFDFGFNLCLQRWRKSNNEWCGCTIRVRGYTWRINCAWYNKRNFFRNLRKSELPVCVDNLLDQRDYQYVNWATSSTKERLVSKTHPHYSCRLIDYTVNRAVTCFDRLSQFQVNARNVTTKPNSKSSKLHFVFMGDSRMRQQFFYFLKVFTV